jgi:hypothetical protein
MTDTTGGRLERQTQLEEDWNDRHNWWKTGTTDTTGGRLERQTQLEEEDNIINKWAQEGVNRLYSVLNYNNNKIISFI